MNLLVAAVLMGAAAACAQNRAYDFQNLLAPNLEGQPVPVWGYISGVSRNGKYAVGSDWDVTYASWLWQNDGTSSLLTQNGTECIALAVSNDGTVVGSYYDEATERVYPGYRTPDGEWHRLQQPAYAQTANQYYPLQQFNDASLPYIPTAYYISGDGEHIGGWTYAAGGKDDDRPGFDAKLHGFFWHRNAEGNYELEDFADMDLSSTQQGFAPSAMNEEGTVLAGLVQREDNGLMQPAAIIDGKLVVIIEAASGEYYQAAQKGTFEGNCFDVEGRYIYGYGTYLKVDEEHPENDIQEFRSFRYNMDTKEVDYLPGGFLLCKVGEDGSAVGIDYNTREVYTLAPDFKTLTELETPAHISDIYAVSADLKVIGGISQKMTDAGIINTPILLQYGVEEEVLAATDVAIDRVTIPTFVKTGKENRIRMVVSNHGEATVRSLEAIVCQGDVTTTASLGQLNIAPGAKATVEVPLTIAADADVTVWVEVAKVNGFEDLQPADNRSEAQTVYAREAFGQRNVLMECFSTENCTNCPAGHEKIQQILGDKPNLIEVTHHAGFTPDKFTLKESVAMEWFYKSEEYNTTFAPAFMTDRTAWTDYPVFYPYGTPVAMQLNAESLRAAYGEAVEVPALATVEVHPAYNAETRELTVNVDAEALIAVPGCDHPVLNVYLVEDGVFSKTQVNTYKEYFHPHLIRQFLTPAWGEAFAADGEISRTYTITLDEDWETEKMTIVAFVSNYNAESNSDCRVMQAEEVVIPVRPATDELTVTNLTSTAEDGIVLTFSQDVKVIHNIFAPCYSEITDKDATISSLNANPVVDGNVVTLESAFSTFVNGHHIHLVLNPACFTTTDGAQTLTGETTFDFVMGEGLEIDPIVATLVQPSNGIFTRLDNINVTFDPAISAVLHPEGIIVENEVGAQLPLSLIEVQEDGNIKEGLIIKSLNIDIAPSAELMPGTTYRLHIAPGAIQCGDLVNDKEMIYGKWKIKAEAEGLGQIETETAAPNIYDLWGVRRTSPAVSGIRIVNGKKVTR